MDFCPECSNLLEYLLPEKDLPLRFSCPTCPYVKNIESDEEMEVDDVCPTCHSSLEFKPQEGNTPARFACPTCQYVRETDRKQTVNPVDPQPSKEEAGTSFCNNPGGWPLTGFVRCPHCGHDEAYYNQALFAERNGTIYHCANWKCGKRWRDD